MTAAVELPGAYRRRAWPKYVSVAALAAREAINERAAVLGRSAFYVVILLIFSQLWGAIGESHAIAGMTPGDLVWYLALTEWVALGVPPLHLDIEAEVRSGDIAYQLPRPISYLGAQLARSAGDIAVRMSTLAVVGTALAYALAGGGPSNPGMLVFALPLALVAALLVMQVHTAIGLSAFWLQDCSPFYWIYQKALFVFGGLMLPLEMYPDWLREFALWTPFAAMLHGPARCVFAPGLDEIALVAARLVFWNAVTAGMLVVLYRRALRVLDVNGG